MNEKTALLPTAPQDFTNAPPPADVDPQGAQTAPPPPTPNVNSNTAVPMPKLILVPGLEFDPARKYRYGIHALAAALMLFISFILVEIRDCNWGVGIDLDKLQALHISLMVFALVLYLLSLFGIADYVFKYKFMFLFGVLLVYTIVALMIWMTYEAAVNPCKKSWTKIPVDLTISPNKNVFNQGDGFGIVILLLDILATIFMFSAAANFYKRY